MKRLEYATLKLNLLLKLIILYMNQWEEFSVNLTNEKYVLHRRPQDRIREMYKLCCKTKSSTVVHSCVLVVQLLYSHVTGAVLYRKWVKRFNWKQWEYVAVFQIPRTNI